ncbi:eukaryotic translation initiation factor 4E-binding protein 2 [Galendromus occidentalis]|uniref:Eukaryotic translation initiation factor 4E-binding protein 2 n=1 Tax=Galendromus occidentalis TaxID=34638 RepID=A0AAJ6QQI3_9ACAR|nr:eukaryotic translation initiation factor 4E-binding protein 2 [Galendromus occidentalis]
MSITSSSIPIRRLVTDPSQLPSDYSRTPGGTLFSTTPGGTRIVYDRTFLLSLQQSPLSQTPPSLPTIPGCTVPKGSLSVSPKKEFHVPQAVDRRSSKTGADDEQFAIDI